jgi:hypothetical protein
MSGFSFFNHNLQSILIIKKKVNTLKFKGSVKNILKIMTFYSARGYMKSLWAYDGTYSYR